MKPITLSVRTFPHLRQLQGIPERTVDMLEQRYRDYVKKTDELLRRLATVDLGTAHPVYSDLRALQRELPHSLGAVKSYEIFFTHMNGKRSAPSPRLAEHIRQDFGTHEAFLAELRASAIASRGWVAVTYDLDLRRLMVLAGDTPEDLTVWNTAPVLVLDVSEWIPALDFGGDRHRYLEVLFRNIDWAVVERNLEDALGLQAAGKPY